MPQGPSGAIHYVSGALERFPDLHVRIEDNDCGRGQSGDGFAEREEYGVSRYCDAANRGQEDVERWDHLEAPHEAEAPHVGKAPHEGEAPA